MQPFRDPPQAAFSLDRKQTVHIVGDAQLLENLYPMDHGDKPNRVLRVLTPGEEVKVLRITEEHL